MDTNILDFSTMTPKQLTDLLAPNKPGEFILKLKGNKLVRLSKNNKIEPYTPLDLTDLTERQLHDLVDPNKPGALMCKLKGGFLYKITKNIPERVLDSNKKPVKVK